MSSFFCWKRISAFPCESTTLYAFEKGGNFYEPQETRKTTCGMQKRYGQIHKETRKVPKREESRN